MNEKLEAFIKQNRKICWESEYENDEYCIGENKVRQFFDSNQVQAVVKPANAFVEAAKDAIDKAHTVALAFAVLRGDKVWNNGYYEAWQNAHIKFQEELKRLSV